MLLSRHFRFLLRAIRPSEGMGKSDEVQGFIVQNQFDQIIAIHIPVPIKITSAAKRICRDQLYAGADAQVE